MRFLADEDFNNDILRGLRRRDVAADVVRVQDTTAAGADDSTVLILAASEQRILLTHDVSTLIAAALVRVRAGSPMPGVLAVPQRMPIGEVLDDLALIVECSEQDEWANQVRFLPLR